uniref:Homeobox-DDT domain protein RLT1 isoform X3 n=1 Tax=Rhizophora mucronata TaxID=61149 RepID=A0A2P2M0P6_RHIMU
MDSSPLLAAANSMSSSCSSSIRSKDSLAILRAVAFSMAALRLTASLSLRSSSFCLLFSALICSFCKNFSLRSSSRLCSRCNLSSSRCLSRISLSSSFLLSRSCLSISFLIRSSFFRLKISRLSCSLRIRF